MPPKYGSEGQRLAPLNVPRDLSAYMDSDSLDMDERERYMRMMSGTTGSVLESPSPVSEFRSPDDVLREVSGISREDSIILPDEIEERRQALKALVAGASAPPPARNNPSSASASAATRLNPPPASGAATRSTSTSQRRLPGVAPYFSAAAESPYPGMDIGTGGLDASFQRVAKGLTSLETRVFSLEQDAAGGGGRINVGAGVWMGDDGVQERVGLLEQRLGDVEQRGHSTLADVRALQIWQRTQTQVMSSTLSQAPGLNAAGTHGGAREGKEGREGKDARVEKRRGAAADEEMELVKMRLITVENQVEALHQSSRSGAVYSGKQTHVRSVRGPPEASAEDLNPNVSRGSGVHSEASLPGEIGVAKDVRGHVFWRILLALSSLIYPCIFLSVACSHSSSSHSSPPYYSSSSPSSTNATQEAAASTSSPPPPPPPPSPSSPCDFSIVTGLFALCVPPSVTAFIMHAFFAVADQGSRSIWAHFLLLSVGTASVQAAPPLQAGGDSTARGILILCSVPCASFAVKYLVKYQKRLREANTPEQLDAISVYCMATGVAVLVLQLIMSSDGIACLSHAMLIGGFSSASSCANVVGGCGVASSHLCLSWVCAILILPANNGGEIWTCRKVMRLKLSISQLGPASAYAAATFFALLLYTLRTDDVLDVGSGSHHDEGGGVMGVGEYLSYAYAALVICTILPLVYQQSKSRAGNRSESHSPETGSVMGYTPGGLGSADEG